MPGTRRVFAFLFLSGLAASILFAQPQRKPIRRPENNELDLVAQEAPVRAIPPATIVTGTRRLVFHVSPLSSKGLLSDQVEDALKALDKANNRATIVKLRAFVAGNGDVRRISTIVAEYFEDKKWPLPVITAVQAGALPMEGAQVVIESISQDRDEVNPGGLAFFSAQEAEDAGQAVARLAAVVEASGASPLRITCFADTLARAEAARDAAAAAFPRVDGAFVQATRFSYGAKVACEGVGRLPEGGGAVESRLNAAGVETRSGQAHAVLIRADKLIFTRAQLAFQDQDADVELAYERLGEMLQEQGAGFADVVDARVYALTPAVAGRVATLRSRFMPADLRPARTVQVFEGLPSYDASMAVELIAAID